MKNTWQLLGITLIVVIGATGCFDDLGIICDRASGSVETRTLTLEDINAIDLQTSANVYISQGDTQEITVKGRREALQKLETSVTNGLWEIDFEECLWDHELEVFITVKNLQSIKISGSGDVFGQTAFESTEQDLSLDIDGSGYISLNANYPKINSIIRGSGDLKLLGAANEFIFKITGSGDIQAFNLISTDCRGKITGSGDAEIFVDGGVLDIEITGSGEVYYKGNPSSFNLNVSGSGNVIDAN